MEAWTKTGCTSELLESSLEVKDCRQCVVVQLRNEDYTSTKVTWSKATECAITFVRTHAIRAKQLID